MIKLSVNETKWSSLLAKTRALILYISIEELISGPNRYRDFRETGPWSFWKTKSINCVAINEDFGTEDLLRGCKIIRLFIFVKNRLN